MSDISDEEGDNNSNQNDELLEKFSSAADHIQKIHSNLSPNQLLEIYGLYKQATIGKCNIPKPGGIFNVQGKSKWSAWNSLNDMTKIDAMTLYINKVIELGWQSDNSNNKKSSSWVCHSVYSPVEEEQILDNEKTIFDHVKEMDMEKLQIKLTKDCINNLDESGLGLIHWATDRNAVEILEFLLSFGADINLQDNDKQTALHYASSCGHSDCLKVLIKYGANKIIKDDEGNTCIDVAFDKNIKLLIEKS